MNSASTGAPPSLVSVCSISAVWRWVSRPYATTLSSASEKWLPIFRPRPAPESPDIASTITCGSTSPAANSGASASNAAVG